MNTFNRLEAWSGKFEARWVDPEAAMETLSY